jgi:hypothetical protein
VIAGCATATFSSVVQTGAVFRNHTNSPYHKGVWFVELFNVLWLGNVRRGYTVIEALLSRLKADIGTKPCKISFVWVAETVSSLGKCADIITDPFARYFLAAFWPIIESFLQQLDDESVRGIPNKEAVDSLVLGLRRMLRRVYATPEESALKAEKIMLEVGLRCCKSPQLMKRREGLRVLSEAISCAFNRERFKYGLYVSTYSGANSPTNDIMRMPVTLAISTLHIASMVSEQQLLRDVFVARHHRELIKMSSDILRVLSAHEGFMGEAQVRVFRRSTGLQMLVLRFLSAFTFRSRYFWMPYDTLTLMTLMQQWQCCRFANNLCQCPSIILN